MAAQSIHLRNVLGNVAPSSLTDIERRLAFFQMSIELERKKEPDINSYHQYPINYKSEKLMVIDFPCNSQFNQIFNDNKDSRKTKWPKDLYIGLVVILDSKAYRLLNMTIAFEDFKEIDTEEELLPVPINNFEVNLREAAKLEMQPEQIDTLNNRLSAVKSFGEILPLLREVISEDVKLQNSIYLALSSKSIELSQIYSELNNVRLKNAIQSQGSLLYAFLTNAAINNLIENINPDEIIRITDLDNFQLQAVVKALSSRISVITGPPGTGKTQVIENILANALLKGKKVLVASKNNKAVDNVKERFDIIDETGYFIRFGAKRFIEETTKPEMNRVASQISSIRKSDAEDQYNQYARYYAYCVQQIAKIHQELQRKLQLARELPTITSQIDAKSNELLSEHNQRLASVEQTYVDIQNAKAIPENTLNALSTKIRKQKNEISSKLCGFFGFWNKLTSKKKYASILLNIFEDFPYQLKAIIQARGIKSEVSQFKELTDFTSYCDTILNVLNRVLAYHSALSRENSSYQRNDKSVSNEILVLTNDFNKKKSIHDDIESRGVNLVFESVKLKEWIKDNGKQIMRLCIRHYLAQDGAQTAISNYKPYLSSNVWKPNEYSDFVRHCKRFLETIRLCSVTSLSAKNALPLTSEIFDMVIIDEASQCDVASAIPLIMRAKQLVVIGDPKQLKHISAVKADEENAIRQHLGLASSPYLQYADCSLWDYCNNFISKVSNGMKEPLMLQCHYRCHPNIIAYSNDVFYSGGNVGRLEVCTRTDKLKGDPQGIVIVDVAGKQTSDVVNINEQEARKAVDIACQVARQYPDVSIGIVTPFKHQAERINQLIPDQFARRIDANTVHKYQGDEKDIMIYSLVVTDNSPDRKINWIDNSIPNLVNVAVTRAKSTLYVVCNVKYIYSHSSANKPLGHLVRTKA